MSRPLRLCLLLAALASVGWGLASSAPGQEENKKPEAQPQKIAPSVDPKLAASLSSPRKTMETFITAMNEDRKEDAAKCLDMSHLTLSADAEKAKGGEFVYKLKEIIDRMVRVQYANIPDASDENQPFRLNYIASGLGDPELSDAARITIERGADGLWKFGTETVDAIDELYETWKLRDKRQSLTAESKVRKPFSIWLADQFPERMRETSFLLPQYQWLCLLILIFLGFVVDMLTRGVLNTLTRAWFRWRRGEMPPLQGGLWKPVGLFVQALVWYGGTWCIGLPPAALTVLLVGLKLFAVVAAVWLSFHLIDLLAKILARQAGKTQTKYDDLLVPLVTKSLKVFATLAGIVICADAFDLQLTGLLATLGLGGMAVAFASKDAISNLFGSVTVLLDRPFEVGDWIVTENIEGTVETVGFRSSRIPTFYNSLITLPNSRLTTATVDNMGRRRFRRIKAMLGVQYDTTPEQIDTFCEGIRELIRRHPYTRKDYYHVYFNQFSGSSLDILLYCFVECPDWAVELRERHRLFVDILTLADRLGVAFAFPTQTLHLFQEGSEAGDSVAPVSDPLAAGRRVAAQVAGPLLPPDRRPGKVEFSGPSDLEEGVESDGGHADQSG